MYVLYVCIHIHIYIRTHICRLCMYCMCVCVRTYTYTYTYIHVVLFRRLFLEPRGSRDVPVCMHTCTHACMCRGSLAVPVLCSSLTVMYFFKHIRTYRYYGSVTYRFSSIVFSQRKIKGQGGAFLKLEYLNKSSVTVTVTVSILTITPTLFRAPDTPWQATANLR